MSPTDPGLDERVCRKLGWGQWGTVRRWKCSACGLVKSGLSESACPNCESTAACTPVDSVLWPPVSTSWEWAGKALDGLPKLTPPIDWLLEFEPGPEHPYTCWLFTKLDANTGSDPVSRGDGDTGPLAIARAIDGTLSEVKG